MRSVPLLLGSPLLCLLLTSPAGGQFTADHVGLVSHLSLADLGTTFAEDCWGYVSPSGREYALIGVSQGTAFVEITDPANPVIVDILGQPNQGRDMKVYQTFVYSSSDAGPTHVYDVSAIDGGVVTLVRSIPQGTHNLAVDEVSGFLYLAVGGPMLAYDLGDPSNPVLVGTWGGQTHDAQVVTYTTGDLAGRQVAFVYGGTDGIVDIVDVTDKTAMFRIGQTSYPSPAYTHQGWLSSDRHYAYLNDELDGISRTTIIDVSNLASPTFVTDFSNGSTATDHNLYYHQGFVFAANYASGLRIFDARNPTSLVEVGFFDTYPTDDAPGFTGAWSSYPFYPSGTVIVSDRSGGLFVLDPSQALLRASVAFRNGGSNPASYTADPVVLGTNWNASVDLSTTGHSFANVVGVLNPASFTLGGGQVLLGSGARVFTLTFQPGPLASWTSPIPNDPSLAGMTVVSQAIHALGVSPYALSNAQDLVLGY